MFDVDFNGAARIAHREHRNEFPVFGTLENGVDDGAGIAAQHAAVVGHGLAVAELADHQIDRLGRPAAEKRVFAVLADRADDVVAFAQLFDEFRNLFRRILKVGVESDDVLADRCPEPRGHRRVLAEVGREEYADDFSAVLFRRLADHLRRIVRAAVVDEDHFV